MCTIENLVLQIQKGEGEEAFVLLEEKIKPLMYSIYYRHTMIFIRDTTISIATKIQVLRSISEKM